MTRTRYQIYIKLLSLLYKLRIKYAQEVENEAWQRNVTWRNMV